MSNLYDLSRDPDEVPPRQRAEFGNPAPVFAAPEPPRELVQRRRAQSLLRRFFGCVVALVFLAAGLGLRWQAWRWASRTDISLHHGDVATAFAWGDRVIRTDAPGGLPDTDWPRMFQRFVATYKSVLSDAAGNRDSLDAPPMRLLAFALWARHEHDLHGPGVGWQPDERFNAPLLITTAGFEMSAAVAMFLFVWLWVRRWRAKRLGYDLDAAPISDVPWLCGLAAAILLWLNPALLLDGYVWGQTDAWLLPFFLLAAFLASVELWLWAGVLIALGSLFKMQLLLIAPLFFLWPLFVGRPLAALRTVAGFVIAGAVLLSPWLIHRDLSWYRVSIAYGINHFTAMTLDASNLPAIMSNKTYDWSAADTVWTFHLSHPHLDWPLTARRLLIGIYIIALILSALGAAWHAKRRSAGVLAAVVAPWVVLFAVLPHMHPRYFVWAAALSAAMAGLSLGMTLLHLVVTAIASEMILRQLLLLNPGLAPKLLRTLSGLHPHIAWAVMLCAAIFLYEALAIPRARRRLLYASRI